MRGNFGGGAGCLLYYRFVRLTWKLYMDVRLFMLGTPPNLKAKRTFLWSSPASFRFWRT